MTLKESLDQVYKLGGKLNQPAKYGLENISRALQMLGNPQEKVPYFHVTGTKGKGSTSKFIASILQAHGYKTGLYISPSLISTLERISINGVLVSPKEFISIFDKLSKLYAALKEDELPTTFETFTIIAFLYFINKNCDYGVLEVGLGGRLDATNVINNPVASIITDISYDHMKYLGDTLEDIAFEKSKIIKKNAPVVLGNILDSPLNVILKEAKENNSPYFIFGKDFAVENVKNYGTYQTFDFVSYSNGVKIKEVFINNPAIFEVIDASIAIQSILVSGINYNENYILKGILEGFFPGRFEVISENPMVILDGAHNDASSKVLSDSLGNFLGKRIKVIFSMLNDKNVEAFLKNLKDVTDELIITTVPNSYSRALNPYEIYGIAKQIFDKEKIQIEENPRRAYFKVKNKLKENEILLVTGSLYLVGFVRTLENIFTFSTK